MTSGWDFERSRVAWWVLGAALGLVLGLVLYSYIGTFVFGVFIYYATRPLYRRLRRYVYPPSLAATTSLLLLALPALLLLAYTVAVGVQEANAFLANNPQSIPQLNKFVGRYLDVARLVDDPQQLLESESARKVIMDFVTQAQGYLGFIGNALLHLFIMIAIAYYLLKDDRRLARWFRQRFADDRGVMEAYAKAVDRDFSNIFFGNILNAVLTAIIGAISYNLIAAAAPANVSLPYPTLLGLLTGVASLVPVVGMKLVYVPMAGYLAFDAASAAPGTELLWFPAVFVAVSFVLVDTIPDFVLRPYVSGRGLHLGMVMFAYIFGPLLWGWYGIFLGPMLLVLVVHFVRLVLPELIAGEEIRPTAAGDAITTGSPEPAVDGEESAKGAEGTDAGPDPEDDAGGDVAGTDP